MIRYLVNSRNSEIILSIPLEPSLPWMYECDIKRMMGNFWLSPVIVWEWIVLIEGMGGVLLLLMARTKYEKSLALQCSTESKTFYV